MRPEMFLPFLVGYGLAVRQCRAELVATESWLQDEVAELRKGLAAARAELHRLRAAQRDVTFAPQAPLFLQLNLLMPHGRP